MTDADRITTLEAKVDSLEAVFYIVAAQLSDEQSRRIVTALEMDFGPITRSRNVPA